MALSRVVSEIFNVEKYRDLAIFDPFSQLRAFFSGDICYFLVEMGIEYCW